MPSRLSFPRRVDRFCFQRSTQRILCGIRTGIFLAPRQDEETAFTKVAAALQLVQSYSPKHFARLRRHVQGILVSGGGGYLAGWYQELRLIEIQKAYVLSEETLPAHVASTLVHEATHAWLEHLGIRYEERNRARIEAICFRSEAAFARHLPDSGDLLELVEQQLSRDQSYWANDAFEARRFEELRELGAPAWLTKSLEWWVRRRRGKGPR